MDRHIISGLGNLKVREVTRSDVSGLITRMKNTPVTANRVQRTNIKPANNATTTEQPTNSLDVPVAMPAGFHDGRYASTTKLGNYCLFQHHSGANRAVPPGTRSGKAKFIAGE